MAKYNNCDKYNKFDILATNNQPRGRYYVELLVRFSKFINTFHISKLLFYAATNPNQNEPYLHSADWYRVRSYDNGYHILLGRYELSALPKMGSLCP